MNPFPSKKLFSPQILEWYSANKRSLPWRDDPSPYHVLISEIMLQQTQVPRVIEKYQEFLALFPTIQALARASKADVIKVWSGLGYNRRALLLHGFAQEVAAKYNGIIPNNPEHLIQLPGIGPYAAGSIAAFAYNKPTPAIDVNVRRIYHRFFEGVDMGSPQGKKEEQTLHELVKVTIPPNKSADFHNALMDFGSLVCTRDAPRCSACPLQSACKFFPLYKKKKEKALFVMEKKQEPGIKEKGKFTPNRIFRGRIVEFVRHHAGQQISLSILGSAIKKDYTLEEEPWLWSLLEKLQGEKIITVSQSGSQKRSMITLFLAE